MEDLQVCLVNERRKNHDSLEFIHGVHEGKAKDRCYKAEKDYKSIEGEEIVLVLSI